MRFVNWAPGHYRTQTKQEVKPCVATVGVLLDAAATGIRVLL